MKLKGLVWVFTIILILISLYQLSFTLVVNSHEKKLTEKAERVVALTNPNVQGDEKKVLVQKLFRHYVDSTRDEKIYPVLGITYQKSKENELQLGLDLQGGMSVTMNVSLEGLLKSLSNNPKDPALNKAINTTTAEKVKSDLDFITLFGQIWKQQNPNTPLASIFGGAGKTIKINDSDARVLAELENISKEAINQTYKVITKRVDQFGVSNVPVNLDINRGVINVELPGVQDPERVRNLLQASAFLQFWEVYNIGELGNGINEADKSLANYLSGLTKDSASQSAEALAQDSAKLLANQHPLQSVIQFYAPQQQPNGQVYYSPNIGVVQVKDTAIVDRYLNMDIVKSNFPGNIKFLFGPEQKVEKTGQRFVDLYAIKTIPGTDKARLEGDAVEDSKQDFDQNGRPAIKMEMTPAGARVWAKMTADNIGKPIAITLDDVVYSAPNVNSVIEGGSSEITGNFTVQEAQDLASILKIGKIDAPAKIVQEQIVGPTLGQKAIRGGITAFIVSFIVIFTLMLLYYNTGGMVANIALIFNLLFTIGILSALGASLTAAGIAALVLTIGMAVDTNVIIFERIKEELARKKTYQQAIHDGYVRSYAPVIDAHVTVFLTAIILFYFGLGPILGFATTQMLGISLSLFCGILISRLVTDIYMNRQRHFKYFTKLSQAIFRHPQFKIIEYRKAAYVLSALVLIFGVASFFNGFNKGVEFKGGRSYTIQFANHVNPEAIRDNLKKTLDGDNVVIKTVGDDRHLDITTSFMKGVANADSTVEARLYEGLQSFLPAGTTQEQFTKVNVQSSQVVQPVISKDLENGAIKAVVLSMIAIILYILLRFRDWRYSVGTILSLIHDTLVVLIIFSFAKNIVPFPLEIDQYFIAAVLTVVGYSMNDTVIIFDRIRENSNDPAMVGKSKTFIINLSINETLSRTIMTSLTTFLTILALFIFGGEVTRGFAFVMLLGIIVGTYSSMFVATPILMEFSKDRPLGALRKKVTSFKKPAPAKV